MKAITKTCLLLISVTMICGCSHKKNTDKDYSTVTLTEETVIQFAHQIEEAILHDNPMVLNNAFDMSAFRDSMSNNSIVFSSLDTDFGKEFWKANFSIGDYCVAMVNQGGDFKFTRYYKQNGEHHIIFRTYCDYGLRIDDYVVHAYDSAIKIKEGYIYNLSSSLSNSIQYDMLYRIMQKTDPDGITKHLNTAATLLDNGKSKEALKTLKDNEKLLKNYPYYWQLYIRALYETSPKNFIRELDQLPAKGIDPRAVLTHKLLYYSNQGEVKATEETINQLIEYTGDDPIYLLFYGRANFEAGFYQDALTCYDNAAKNISLIWDIWYGLLECYHKLNDKENFDKTAKMAEQTFGMNESEIEELIQKEFHQ